MLPPASLWLWQAFSDSHKELSAIFTIGDFAITFNQVETVKCMRPSSLNRADFTLLWLMGYG